MFIGQRFINRKTGQPAKIVETATLDERGNIETRYRLSGENRFLSPEQLRREYGQVAERTQVKA